MSKLTVDKFGHVIMWLEVSRCEDCDDRGALDDMGEPRRHPWYGTRLTGACAGCGGTGRSMPYSPRFVFDESVLRTRLTLKQRFVMERRLGVFDGRKYGQAEIARAMGVTKQAVSKLEQAAKERLETTARKGLTSTGCIRKGVEGKNPAGEAPKPARRRSSSVPSPQQRITGSRCWDLYFAGTPNAHTYEKDS